MVEEYASEVGAKVKQVSAKENIGITEIFDEIAEEIGKKYNYQSVHTKTGGGSFTGLQTSPSMKMPRGTAKKR